MRQEKLFGILIEEQKSLNRQVELFNGQTQKLNTAISIQAQRDSFKEIKSHLESADTVNEILTQIELIALWLLRTLIQLANLICGRFIALYWKELKRNSTIKENSKPLDKPKVVRQWKARYTRNDKGFIGILERTDGKFIAVSPNGSKEYTSFQRALNFFNGSSIREKIPVEPTNEKF